jgi:hypothetical protein
MFGRLLFPRKRMHWVFGGAVLLAVLVAPSGAFAAGQAQATGGGAGCQANGQVVAGAAKGAPEGPPPAVPFGKVVRTNVPIADNVAAFKAAFCNSQPA